MAWARVRSILRPRYTRFEREPVSRDVGIEGGVAVFVRHNRTAIPIDVIGRRPAHNTSVIAEAFTRKEFELLFSENLYFLRRNMAAPVALNSLNANVARSHVEIDCVRFVHLIRGNEIHGLPTDLIAARLNSVAPRLPKPDVNASNHMRSHEVGLPVLCVACVCMLYVAASFCSTNGEI